MLLMSGASTIKIIDCFPVNTRHTRPQDLNHHTEQNNNKINLIIIKGGSTHLRYQGLKQTLGAVLPRTYSHPSSPHSQILRNPQPDPLF